MYDENDQKHKTSTDGLKSQNVSSDKLMTQCSHRQHLPIKLQKIAGESFRATNINKFRNFSRSQMSNSMNLTSKSKLFDKRNS